VAEQDFVSRLQDVDEEAADWFSGSLEYASVKLRGRWPAMLPEPSPDSPLALYLPGIERR
jgi:hypothetical protein